MQNFSPSRIYGHTFRDDAVTYERLQMSRQLILLIFRIPLTFFPGKQLMFSSGFSSNFFALLTVFAPPWRLFNTNHDLCIAWQSSRACYFSIQHFFIFWFCYGANLKINGAFHIKVPMDIYGDFHGYMGIGYKCKCIQCPLHVVYLVFVRIKDLKF